MAAMLRQALAFGILIYAVTFCITNLSAEKVENKVPCNISNFIPYTLPCDLNRKRKVVYYMDKHCDLSSNESIPYPKMVKDLPCDCPPGFGEMINSTDIKCKKCKAGFYSHGGVILDNWKRWNETGIPGFSMDAFPYCSDFLTGKSCQTWQAGGNGDFLVSGDAKNLTELRCFEQSILALSRNFVGLPKSNKVSFRYRVDGSPCRRGTTVCSNGLHFYINNKLIMKADVQYQWKNFEHAVQPGFTQFKFVYQRSCTKEPIEDIAYLKYISMVGTEAPNTECKKCPPGTFSNKEGASDCEKCMQNFYQDLPGKTQCKPCKVGSFSRIGGSKCNALPPCLASDYFYRIDDVSQCTMVNNKWVASQQVLLPELPGMNTKSCIAKDEKEPPNPDIPCICQPGYVLDTSGKNPTCARCKVGEASDGKGAQCKQCPKGSAAIPGYYLDFFPGKKLTRAVTQNCTGDCPKDAGKSVEIWETRGKYLATHRFAGNFESTLQFSNIHIDYVNAKLSFNCSVDCRMTYTDKPRLAKHNHCYLKFAIKKGNKTVKSTDCVSRYYHNLRNGTERHHDYLISEPGNYTFTALFHHEDEANYSLVSYEARIHYIHIFGAAHGSSRACVICPAGTKVSEEKNLCVECPPGTYSKNGSTTCMPCPAGTFSDQKGSAACTKCGGGTTSNAKRDGCDYNNCTFSPAEGIMYDLSPLKVDGGPMYRVRTYNKKAHYYFPLIYHINLCSLVHDNSSCYVKKRKIDMNDPRKRLQVVSTSLVRTMACKRWSFDKYQSYSIGKVLNFLPLKNISSGLMINLTHGYQCWNRLQTKHVAASTSIMMLCDLDAGRGEPEGRSNQTAIDKYCHYELLWRTMYACPVCHDKDYSKVFTQCKDGKRFVTKKRVTKCRTNGDYSDIMVHTETCSVDKQESNSTSKKPLIIIMVVFALAIIILIVFVVYYARRNRYLRDTMFLPGKSFSRVQEDEDELVDNMHM